MTPAVMTPLWNLRDWVTPLTVTPYYSAGEDARRPGEKFLRESCKTPPGRALCYRIGRRVRIAFARLRSDKMWHSKLAANEAQHDSLD